VPVTSYVTGTTTGLPSTSEVQTSSVQPVIVTVPWYSPAAWGARTDTSTCAVVAESRTSLRPRPVRRLRADGHEQPLRRRSRSSRLPVERERGG
jgi:hypothetical protein